MDMSKNRKIFIIIICVIAFLFLWALLRGPEDSWICVDGQWVEHGFPYAPMPEGECSLLDNLNPFR